MVCLMPEACIDAEIGHLGHSILINGFLFWLITVVLIYLLLKLLMNPLKELSVQMQRTGAGDFPPEYRQMAARKPSSCPRALTAWYGT